MTSSPDQLPARKTRDPEIIPPESEYPLLDQPQMMQRVLRRIKDNLDGQKFDILQLPRVKVTRDGVFQIETPAGIETARQLTGVIVAFRQARIYWGRAYTGAKDLPSCTSQDGFIGVGNPGGDCATCPYSQFKSAKNPDGSQAAGQACKELRQLLLLLPGYSLPHRLDIPPTSIQAFQKYTLSLSYADADYWSVTTKMTLEQAPTASGIPITRVGLMLQKRLSSEQAGLFEPYHREMRSLLKPMTVEADAYEILEAPPAG